VPEIEKGSQGPRRILYALEGQCRITDLGYVGIRHLLDVRHGLRGPAGLRDIAIDDQAVALVDLIHDRADPLTEQGVAAAEVVVQKGERSANREGVQPKRQLGELDRHRVLVDAENHALEDHAPDDLPVVELLRVDGPALARRLPFDPLSDGGDAGTQG
jgi:hypothetical protein